MALNLTILGCGYVGTALAKSALNKGWNVSALTRNTQKGEELDSIGVQQVIISDLSSTEWHSHLNPNQDFVVNCVGYYTTFLS